VDRKTLSLKKPADPEKIARSLQIGFRFVDRKGRYIMQAHVRFETKQEHTWIDIPLCPETYGEAQA
jgi:hypothetical protein